ncbi:MAG: hypothetical protein RQ745_04170 [Longimicrobiales bacterium]|nr:hypothetical protein [Longimicrobiales bacterium]
MFTITRPPRIFPSLLLALVLAAAPSPSTAQDTDTRWRPWTGCWNSVDDAEALLCVEPAEGGIEFLTVSDGGTLVQEEIIADGSVQTLDLEGCEGVRRAEFSRDGERIYLRDEIDCNGTREVVTGVIAMIAPEEWIDIRGSIDGRGLWSRTFRRVSDAEATAHGFPDANDPDDLSVRLMRWRASEPSDFADLIEVHERTGEGVTRAWVSEQLDPFPVNADALLSLSRAGVPESVIDVVVAHAFPERFVLAEEPGRQAREGEDPRTARAFTYVTLDPYYGSFGSLHGFNSARFGHGFGSHFGGFGPHFGGSFFHDRTIFVERRRNDPDASNGVRPVPGGGFGRRGPGGNSTGTAIPRDAGMGAQSIGSGASYSGERSTGRTARRRGGGGG